MFGAAAPAGAATESFALSSASLSGQSSVTWQGPPVNPPSTPNDFPDATTPITLTGQIDPSSGAITGASLSLPAIEVTGQGEQTYFALSDSGKATGNFNSSTGAVTLNDTLTLTFTVPAIPITCVSTPINVAFSGAWDSTTENVTLAASGFTIPQFPAGSGQGCSLAAPSLNASPGGTAGAIGNAMTIALHGQFTPGLPTTTSLAVSPNSPQLQGTAVTLTATVAPASGSGAPTGSVTFFDNGANIGSDQLNGSNTASLTTSTLPSGTSQHLTAQYAGDTTYSGSTSSTVPYTVTPLPTVAPNLPASITVPSASVVPTVSAGANQSAISPDAGPTAGGTRVTIIGTGFIPGATVDFGSTPATDVTVNSSTSITATSPAGSGTVDVTVTTTPGGTSATSPADLFTYGAPTVTAVGPSVGPANTSFTVAITGTGFTPDATVNFGSTAATHVIVFGSTSIWATSPQVASGTVDVTVTTPGGTSATSAADRYTYSTTAPVVSDLGTAAGPTAGGTSVVIDGYNFSGATAVSFGSTPAASFTVNNSTSITATSPAGTGTVDVTVITPNGTSTKWLFDQFIYGPPTVTGVSPSGGPAGSTVTITGTGFGGDLPNASSSIAVMFGTRRVSWSSATATSIIATAPKQTAGIGEVDVTVKTPGGTSATSPVDQFTYAPTVTGISPLSGSTAGGTAVTITGSSFTGATAVNFGTAAAANVVVVSSTEITATSPAGSAGATDVTVTTPFGTSATSTADQFFYGPPMVSAVGPNAGPTSGGTQVTISGAGLGGASAVKFGSTPASSFSVVSPTQVTAVSPAGSGLVHVTVTTNGGTSSASGTANEFTFNSVPSVTSLSPDTGPTSGGTGVTITGVNFTAANGVHFGSTPASFFTVVNDTTITATAPSGSGAVDVTVSSAAGTSAAGPGDVFAYGLPTVTNVAPSAGATSGGTAVVITGTGFVSGTTVTFGSVAATATITSPTSITAISPAQAAGPVDITVTNAAGTSAKSASDVFTYSTGGTPGQTSLTITNPSTGQAWNNLYAQIVLSGVTSQPASNVTLSYQDSSGDWCPLTLSGTSTITTYFSGVGGSCGSAPGSFSLSPGVSLTVPIQLSYHSGTYLGVQSVTATLYSGTCSPPTSCAQSGLLNGSVVGSGTVQLVPPALLPSTVTDTASPSSTTPFQQGFQATVKSQVSAISSATGTPTPTGSVEYLVDGSPATLTSAAFGTPVANPVPLSRSGSTAAAYVSTAGLSPGVHTLTSEYSGDSVFAPSTLTESFTVLAAPAGTPFTCSYNIGGGFAIGTGLGYVTASSPSPAPVTSGSSAWVHDTSVSVTLDPAIFGSELNNITGNTTPRPPTTFALSPGGSLGGLAAAANSSSATNALLVWSGMSGAVPVTGDPGSTVPISIGSFGYSVPGVFSFTCTPVSGNAPLTSATLAGTTLTASPSGNAVPGAPVTLSAAVSPLPTANPGTVEFYDGSTLLGGSPVNTTTGTATYTTSQLTLGDHQLSAVWSGGGGVPANTSNTVDYQVGSSSTTTLASSANPANAANLVTFTATVNGAQDSPVPTGDVSFAVDGASPAACQNVALSTASPPTATCKLSLKAGTAHSVVATYSGDATYIGSSSDSLSQSMLPGTTSTLTTAKNPAPAGNVTFWDGVAATGGGAVPTGTVAFTVDNKSYTACAHQPLGPGGGASCTLSFKAGTTHTVYATYAGSSSYSGSTSNTISLKVNGASSSTKPKATTSGSATLGSGKSLTAGQSLNAGSYRLTMQTDGNLVEYQGSTARWASGTEGHSGTKVTMQKDGNLVEYQGSKAIWASGTSGHTGSHLALQGSDGNVVIYTPANKPVWATGT